MTTLRNRTAQATHVYFDSGRSQGMWGLCPDQIVKNIIRRSGAQSSQEKSSCIFLLPAREPAAILAETHSG